MLVLLDNRRRILEWCRRTFALAVGADYFLLQVCLYQKYYGINYGIDGGRERASGRSSNFLDRSLGLARSVRYESNPLKDPQFIGLFAIF